MALIQSILILEPWLIGQNILKKFSLPEFGIKNTVCYSKKLSCIAHVHTERVKNLNFIRKCKFIYH
jgi:hypothetical protein